MPKKQRTKAKSKTAEPHPEPEAIECHICTLPIAPAMMVNCETCTYKQCFDCVIKMGCVCFNEGCMHVHYKCPQCNGFMQPFDLHDDRVSKDHVLTILENLRSRNKTNLTMHHDELEENMGQVISRFFEVARGRAGQTWSSG